MGLHSSRFPQQETFSHKMLHTAWQTRNMHHCRTACRARCHFLDISVRFLATSWNANWIKVIQRQICTNASYVTAYHVSKGRLIAQTWLQLLLPMALLFLKQTLEKFCELFEWRFHYVFWEFGNKIQSCSKNNKNKY